MEVIRFDNVYFSYEQEETNAEEKLFDVDSSFAVNGVSLSIEEGEFVAVLGHNGSGKSTLSRLANGLLTPTQGQVTAFGLSTADEKNLFEIRKQVGIVFQNPDNQTVASIVEDDIAFGPENIGLPREEIGERIEFSLNAVGMQAFRSSTPSRLSGGQKQRIAIAGVLALKPRVMILDEATAMLDPKGRKEVMEVVSRLNREEKITVIVITHFPEEALLADRAIVMSEGKIVMEGKPADILSKGEELKKYSLTMPTSIEICRALTNGGLAVEDANDLSTVAENIATAFKRVNPDKIQTTGAGACVISKEPQEGEAGRVVCQNLSYIYNPSSAFETHALHEVNLEIYPRDFFGIIGHTGSGKSTFVQHLNALLKTPTAEKKYKPKKRKKGEQLPTAVLRVNGYDLTDKKTDFKALRARVGMVFQYPEYQLFAETVFEDIAFGLKNFSANLTDEEVETAVRAAMETVGLSYESLKDRSPFELSGGQKRRVAIAGVIVTKPEILVLDEPAAGLDPLGKEEIMRLLHKLHSEWCKTVIIVSHNMDEIAENCNRVAVFSEGKTVACGTPTELFSQTEKMDALGLDSPFTAKLVKALQEKGHTIACDYTVGDFVEKTLLYAKKMGAGMRSLEGGGVDA